MKAREKYQLVSELEDLQMALANYSLKSFLNEGEAINSVVNGLFKQELIDWADGTIDDSGNYIDYNQYEDENGNLYVLVKKGENSYRVFLNSDDTYTADIMPLAGGGTLRSGTFLVTESVFSSGENLSAEEKGKFTIEGDTRVIFKESLGTDATGMKASGEMLSISVEEGAKAKIYFNYDNDTKALDGKTYYFLTNEGLKRSAIKVGVGATLDLVISKNVVVTVDSGFGEEGETATAAGAKGGAGGFAGINVPSGAELNLYGSGELIAIGGNAGDGGGAVNGDTGGGGGGRSWCWNWR